jgi:MoaA/NifB/PqqE/SkfB family radical SAM enzyme
VITAVNCCPSSDMVISGGFKRLMELAKDLGCSYVQAIHGKSAGGWLGKTDAFNESEELISRLCGFHLTYNSGGRFHDFPSLSAQVFEESEEIFGCTAGGVDRFYLGADGELQPCEFLNISFGNVLKEDFQTIYSRMRSYFKKPGTRWLCCAEAAFIDRVIKENGLTRTPVPWEITRTFIEAWDKGRQTPLYRRLGIYR